MFVRKQKASSSLISGDSQLVSFDEYRAANFSIIKLVLGKLCWGQAKMQTNLCKQLASIWMSHVCLFVDRTMPSRTSPLDCANRHCNVTQQMKTLNKVEQSIVQAREHSIAVALDADREQRARRGPSIQNCAPMCSRLIPDKARRRVFSQRPKSSHIWPAYFARC